MLRTDVAVSETRRVRHRQLDNAFCAGGQTLSRRAGDSLADIFFKQLLNQLRVKTVFIQYAAAETLALRGDAEEQMLCADIAVSEISGVFLGFIERVSRSLCKSVIISHVWFPPDY
jgi:hypothetical protein